MNNIDFATVIPKFDAILERGLSNGVGKRDGQMCVEAAICAALDLPHGDDPQCVATSVRSFKIRLNDSKWSSPEARAKGLRNLGIAQLGSLGVVDDKQFVKRMAEETIGTLIPALFREVFPNNQKCLDAAVKCEQEKSRDAAADAYAAAAAAYAAYAAADANAANVAAYAAANAAADAYAAAAADAAADANAANVAAYAAANAANAATAADANAANVAAYAAANAANAATAAYAADATKSNKYLNLSAQLALKVLRELKSPGCEWV